MKTKLKAIRGTHDILPGEVELWQKVESCARRLFELYGFREIRTPLLEETQLFTRSIGVDTDIVQKEMYSFRDLKGKGITLRPEGTAPVVRAYLEHNLSGIAKTHKLYYVGPMFRRERPQKGRYRQFHQIGAEVLGSEVPAVEAEMLEMLDQFFRELGLGAFRLLVNSVGCQDCRPAYVKCLRRELDSRRSQFCSQCQQRIKSNPLRVLDCKEPACQPAIQQLPILLNHLCGDCQLHFEQLLHYLDLQEIEYQIEPLLVRGLDYYVRTTFEIVSDQLGPTQNAVLGGGRYDGLSESLGGTSTTGFGFALGMERFLMLLSPPDKREVSYRVLRPVVFLVHLDEPALEESLKLARDLRRQGLFAYLDFERRSLKAQMRQADRFQAMFTCVVGESEIQSGQFPLRRMSDGREVRLGRNAIAKYLNQALRE